jgi:regulator of protease activity HflC (stomatin/prohibitin superfamily)
MFATPRESLSVRVARRVARGIAVVLTEAGIRRRRTGAGELEPRAWGRLLCVVASLVAVVAVWTSLHVVAPGSVGVPVTLGRPAQPLGAGFHVTWPFTSVSTLTVRTQNYSMTSNPQSRPGVVSDDAVPVLGADGGAANVNAAVLFRLDPRRATEVYRTLGTGYAKTVVRPDARTCIRAEFTRYSTVTAATMQWHRVETEVAACMRRLIEPKGLVLADFQLLEVALNTKLQTAVDSKVASEQRSEQQKFEIATARQVADVARIQALATADAQQILACGGQAVTKTTNGRRVPSVTPNPLTDCSQAQLSPEFLQFTYIQALKDLVSSPNGSTIVLPFDQGLTPLLNVNGGSK